MKSIIIITLNIFFIITIQAAETYPIQSCFDLNLIKQHPSDNFYLTTDIECTNEYEIYDFKNFPLFKGNFDGRDHSLQLKLNGKAGDESLSLFNGISKNAVFQNVQLSILIETTATGENVEGACLTMSNSGTIKNVELTCRNLNNNYEGSFAGFAYYNSGTITDSRIHMYLRAFDLAGIAEYNSGIIKNVYGSIGLEAIRNVAGVVGHNGTDGVIKKVVIHNLDIIIPPYSKYRDCSIGGFAKSNGGIIDSSFLSTSYNLSLNDNNTNPHNFGGFVAFNFGEVEYSGATSDGIITLGDNSFFRYGKFFGNDSKVSNTNGSSYSVVIK